MKKDERETLRLRVVNFYHDAASGDLKTTWNFFKREGCCYSTIYRIIQRYLQFKTTKDLPRSGRPRKLSDKQMKTMARNLNNKSGISHRVLSIHYNVHYRTIGRNLKQRTNIRPRKRIKAPKYVKEQGKRAQKNCGYLYRRIPKNCLIIMDDEKYFSLSGVDIPGNSLYYTSDPSTAPANIKYKQYQKFEPKVLVWLAIAAKGCSKPYIHKSKNAVTGDVYLKQCIQRRLIPFIDQYHPQQEFIFWPDLAKAHYTPQVLHTLQEKNIPFVPREKNPPNIPQVRPVEDLWGILKQKVYAQNYEAKSLDQLARRIREKIKELDKRMIQDMMFDIRSKLRKMWREGVFTTCH
ncbi:unnamed protein product [Rotaria sordida]|uniref:Transposase n=1 Tax=Rotaria sordida TaxID=392033 RepID=A0A815ALZ5_9BILA|nr:unnamed protein product [Rotaria sordida]